MHTSTRRFSLPVGLLVWALGTWTLGSDAAAQDRSLRFQWPVPSDVDVTEQRIEEGQSMVVSYRVELRPGDKEGELLVRRRQFKILEIENLDMELYQELIAPRTAQLGTQPDLRVDAQGKIVGTESWTSFSARLEQPVHDLVESGNLDEEHAGRILEQMRAPDRRTGMLARATDFWTFWVSGWLDNDFTNSEVIVAETGFPLPNGDVVRGPQTLRHHGPEEAHEGHVRLSMDISLSGDDARQRVIAMSMQQPPPAAGEPGPIPPEEVTGVEVGNQAWLIVRPGTMQPLEAQTENRILIQGRDDKREIVDRRHYKFDWK